jgi:anthranilate phosphoribosyltransferase
MLKNYINKLMHKENLTADECQRAVTLMLHNKNVAQTAAFITLLHAKPEASKEIIGMVQAMQQQMRPVKVDCPVLDIVGTGGDNANTINISTGAAILAASCGVKIAKHGNRSVSSLCGSADVLEQLGVNINLTAGQVSECIDQIGFGFCYAPLFHPAFIKLKAIRNTLGVSTTFNLLGPLLNPTQPQYAMIGVFSERYMEAMADAVMELNFKKAMVFHGAGLDEISCIAKIKVFEITVGKKRDYYIDPEEYGLALCSVEDLRGGTAKENAAILQETFSGKPGPIADSLILNAGIATYLYGITNSIAEGVELAKTNFKLGKAKEILQQLVEYANSFREALS